MKRASIVTAVVLIAGIVAAIALHIGGRSESQPANTVPSSSLERAPDVEVKPLNGSSEAAVESDTNGDTSATAAELSYAQRFKQADDYLAFSHSILEAAKSGDRDAQFYLYRVLHSCDQDYKYFFKRGTRWLTLDEALQRVSTRPTESIDDVRDVYAKCHALIEQRNAEQFGAASDWLAKATAAGQPLALAASAHQLVAERVAMQAQSGLGPEAASKPQRSSVEMLEQAIKSREPGVLWTIGELQVALHGYSASAMKSQWAWWLAACQRGYDCSAGSQWYRYSCRVDYLCQPGETAVDYIRRSTQNDFPEIEQQAKEINAKIDAGDWEGLGLQS